MCVAAQSIVGKPIRRGNIKRGTGAMDAVCTGNLNPDVVRRGSGVMK